MEALTLYEGRRYSIKRRIQDLKNDWASYKENSALSKEQRKKIQAMEQQLKDGRVRQAEELGSLSARLTAATAEGNELTGLRLLLEKFRFAQDVPGLESQLVSHTSDYDAKASAVSSLTTDLERSRKVVVAKDTALGGRRKQREALEAEPQRISEHYPYVTKLYNSAKEQLAAETCALAAANKRCKQLEQKLGTKSSELRDASEKSRSLADRITSASSESKEIKKQRDKLCEQLKSVSSDLSESQGAFRSLEKRHRSSEEQLPFGWVCTM